MNTGNALPVMFNNMEEVLFLRSCLKPTDIVLEWGCGGSTLEIAKHVKFLFSIENYFEWYCKVKPLLSGNVSLAYVPRNQEEAPGDDGTYEDYKDYITYPINWLNQNGAPRVSENKLVSSMRKESESLRPDVIFIDGRARVECAKVAAMILKPGGIILMHDYRNPDKKCRRYEYEKVEEFLEVVDGEYALWKFKVKK